MTQSDNSARLPLSVIAPAKINLYLHITGKREDGYHLLDSYTIFTHELADRLTFSHAQSFRLTAHGPYASVVPEENLITRAVDKVMSQRPPLDINLEKNIPAGAGLGGGSSDAATTIRVLERLYDLKVTPEDLLALGADVPACYHQKPCRFSGIGEIIENAPAPPPCHAVIIWPNCHSATKDVFAINQNGWSGNTAMPSSFRDFDNFIAFLKTTRNDLEEAAISLCPAIKAAKEQLQAQNGCALARMSGSGSAVFGLFKTQAAAQGAVHSLRKNAPDSHLVQAVSI